jgi:hypothetical protein
MPEQSAERRRFNRIATDKRIVLRSTGAEHTGTVRDVSLRGLLFDADDNWQPEIGTTIVASVQLDDEQCSIDMDGEAVHVEGNRIGMRCTSLDVESASRLRRLVELNLGDPGLLERELVQMIAG